MSSFFYNYSLPSAAWSSDEKQILEEAEDLIHNYQGLDFIDDVSKYLSHTLKMDYVFIGKMTNTGKGKVQTASFYQYGNKMPNIEYSLEGTPTESVLRGELCYYPQGIQVLYPKDLLLREYYVESYIGQPLMCKAGNTLGIIVLMHREIIPQASFVEALLSFISMRAERELQPGGRL